MFLRVYKIKFLVTLTTRTENCALLVVLVGLSSAFTDCILLQVLLFICFCVDSVFMEINTVLHAAHDENWSSCKAVIRIFAGI